MGEEYQRLHVMNRTVRRGKKRSAAALGQQAFITESPEGATEPSFGAKSRRKGTADFVDDADKHNHPYCDTSAISAQSAVKLEQGRLPTDEGGRGSAAVPRKQGHGRRWIV